MLNRNKKFHSTLKSFETNFFSRDADEIETWMLEKRQLAQEENYKVDLSGLYCVISFIECYVECY